MSDPDYFVDFIVDYSLSTKNLSRYISISDTFTYRFHSSFISLMSDRKMHLAKKITRENYLLLLKLNILIQFITD